MIATIRQLYRWWNGRFERRYREAQVYYDQQTKEALMAEWIGLEVKRRSSRRWELLLGLVLTIIFSEDLKRLLAIILALRTGVSINELQESVVMSLVVVLLVLSLLLAIVLDHFSYSLLLRRYFILKQYLKEHPLEQR